MNILYNTYPIAYHTPGGGEVQLDCYYKYVNMKSGFFVEKYNQWDPNFGKFDLVHFFSLMGGSNPFCSFIKHVGLPLAVTTSLWVNERNFYNYPIDEIREQMNYADKLIVNSNLEADNLREYFNIDPGKFFTVYNAVSSKFFEDISDQLFREHFNIYDRFLLCVGNIEERKNQILLAKAIHQFPDYKLVIIGHIRQKNYFEELLKVASDQLIYLGPVDNNSDILVSAYRACDLFVLPSLLETPGLASLEAAAAGAKIVITEVGSAKEYFDDRATYCNPYSLESLSNAISVEIKHERNCVDLIKDNYTWERQTDRLTQVYLEMVGNSN